MAPKLQTIYEYYYTSEPAPDSKKSFTDYYDFKFAKLDCVAFSDACDAYNVTSFPTMLFFESGKELNRTIGEKNIQGLSELVEVSLEHVKPGSRPRAGVSDLPEAGAKGTGKSTSPSTALKLSAKPNVNGTSKNLNYDDFQFFVKKTIDPWFIKFYAPWCHHCQAMRPAWEAMAKDMESKLNVGEVNCEAERKLCKENKVGGYPTLKMIRGSEEMEYDGLRGVGDLKAYAESATGATSGVPEVDSKEFEKLEKKEDVIFTYFYNHATTSEDFMALERLPLHVVGKAKLVKSKDDALSKRFKISTWPRLAVIKEGTVRTFPGLMPQEMRNVTEVITWMKANWLPLLPELTAAKSHDIVDGKYAVLGILNRENNADFSSAIKEMKQAALEWMEVEKKTFDLEREKLRNAKQLRVEEATARKDENALVRAKLTKITDADVKQKQVGFAWVDGTFWERWIRTTFGISSKDGERVIIYDIDVSFLFPTPLRIFDDR